MRMRRDWPSSAMPVLRLVLSRVDGTGEPTAISRPMSYLSRVLQLYDLSKRTAGRITFLLGSKALHIGKNGRSARSARVGARVGTEGALPHVGLHHGGTQHMSLSATNVQTTFNHRHVGTKRIVLAMECDRICTRRPAQVQTK